MVSTVVVVGLATVVGDATVVLVVGSWATVVSEPVGSTVVLGITPAPAESLLNVDGRQAPVAGGANPKARATAAENTARPFADK